MREANQTDTQDKKALFRKVQAERLQRTKKDQELRRTTGAYMGPHERLMHDSMRAVHRAIRNRILARQPCEVCGASPDEKLKHGRPLVQAHHDDYRYPLNVRWLCMPHHRSWHAYNLAREATADMLGMGTNDLFWLGIEQLGVTTSSKYGKKKKETKTG